MGARFPRSIESVINILSLICLGWIPRFLDNLTICGAWKIIYNDTELDPISWELDIENPIFNFCVGVWVRGPPRANFFPGLENPYSTFFLWYVHFRERSMVKPILLVSKSDCRTKNTDHIILFDYSSFGIIGRIIIL